MYFKNIFLAVTFLSLGITTPNTLFAVEGADTTISEDQSPQSPKAKQQSWRRHAAIGCASLVTLCILTAIKPPGHGGDAANLALVASFIAGKESVGVALYDWVHSANSPEEVEIRKEVFEKVKSGLKTAAWIGFVGILFYVDTAGKTIPRSQQTWLGALNYFVADTLLRSYVF